MKEVILIFLILLNSGISYVWAEDQRAQWITAEESQSTTNLWMCFRHAFTLVNVPSEAKTRIAADTKYWLWINGEMVVFEGGVKRGPNPADTYFDEVDIAPYLRQGENLVAILLWHFGKEGFSHNPSGKAGLFVECRADTGFSLVSNNEWRSIIHPAYMTAGKPLPNYRLSESSLLYDARYDLGDWQTPSFQPKGWRRSVTLGTEGVAPWNKFHYRVIPQWKDYGMVDYVQTELREGTEIDTLIGKLPYNAHVTPYLKVEAASGEKITIHTDHYTGGGPYNVRAEYITKDGIQEYESFGWMNGHRVYYVVPKGVKIIEVKYRETSYDTEFSGAFKCNDPFLNELWKKSRRTLLVTMRDTYMDCPDRERAQWWGDEVNESGEAFYALCPKSHLLMKKGMYELMGWQRDDGTIFSPVPASNYDRELPGQMLAAIGQYGFWNYYLNTGDHQPIVDLYEGVKRYLNVWKIDAKGNLEFRTGGWPWGDWGTNVDKNLLFNEWYYLALKGAKNMAGSLGIRSDVIDFDARMESFRKAFNAQFWTGDAYRHPDYKGETDDRVQALAVVAGLADAALYPKIFETLRTNEYASPYMEKYVIEALFMMEQEGYGIQRMKRRFAYMVNDPERTTLYEGWGIGDNGFGGGTTNHAWSGGGLTILSQYVCGIAPVEPGYKVFQVLPQPAGLEYAKATVPSVLGEITASFKSSQDKFEVEVKVPAGASSIVGIPREHVKTIHCRGKKVWENGRYVKNSGIEALGDEGNYIKFKVSGGEYAFNASK